MQKFPRLFLILSCLCFGGFASCGSYLQRTSRAANNHIMLVDPETASFGFKRLQALSGRYPDLEKFFQREGLPRYLAETQKKNYRYLFLYYPASRQTFVCRADRSGLSNLEYSGPYPITDNELSTLRKLETGTAGKIE